MFLALITLAGSPLYIISKMPSVNKIRTRIAPSPTGVFHLGTARTALFSYLVAKQKGGEFLLRFEDTDAKRSKKEFEDDIIDGLKWLGLDWDDEIVYQSGRLDIYREKAEELIKKGAAYKKDGAVYFKIKNQKAKSKNTNQNEKIKFDDLIRGEISFDIKDLKDFVLVRSDGVPLFMLTNVVDDYEIDKVTHIIRGEDHITNTAYQLLIAQALGYDLEKVRYGHISLIVNKDHSKMSKRHDPVSVTKDFRDKGYLPEAIINYLVLLGWNPGEGSEEEFFTLEDLLKKFSIEKMGSSPSIFEQERLDFFNHHYLQEARVEKTEFANEKIIVIVKERAVTLDDIDRLAKEILTPPEYDADLLIFKKSNLENTKKGLELTLGCLGGLGSEKWESADALKIELEKIVAENNLANGDLFWPVRVALSGREKSNPPQELLWALEKEESLARIKKAVEKLK